MRCRGRLAFEVIDGRRRYRYRCLGCKRDGVAKAPRKLCNREEAPMARRSKAVIALEEPT